MEGDGYRGDKSPLTHNEVFNGLSAERAQKVDQWAWCSSFCQNVHIIDLHSEFVWKFIMKIMYTEIFTILFLFYKKFQNLKFSFLFIEKKIFRNMMCRFECFGLFHLAYILLPNTFTVFINTLIIFSFARLIIILLILLI